MPSKPTYDELKQKVKLLEQKLAAQRKIEKILWNEKDRLYMVFDCLDAIVYVADMESYEVLFANKFTENIFGKVTGKICWQTLQNDQTGPCGFCTNSKLLTPDGRPKDPIVWEFQNTISNKWYHIHDRAIEWFDGRIVRLEIAVDITDRKNAEAALLESEERFRTFADFTYDWEYLVSPEKSFDYISPSCERITGYSPQEFKANPELVETVIHPEDRPHYSNHLKNCLKRDKACHLDFRIITRGGEERWISHYCQAVYGQKGVYLGRRASNRDISERKKTEKNLQLAIAKLEQSNQDLQNFASMVSHDLKEPVIIVEAFSKRLRTRYKDGLNTQGLNYLQRIESTTQRMQTMIDGMLQYSRIVTGPKRLTQVNLAGIAKEVLSDLDLLIQQKKALVALDDLPSVTAAPDQIYQLLKNLISNALKFHKPEEAPNIRIYSRIPLSRERFDGPLEIIVEDKGIGFNKSDSGRIFDLRKRLNTDDLYVGNGIGLSVCKRIVERHGWEIIAESEPGHGSKFIIRVPSKNIDTAAEG